MTQNTSGSSTFLSKDANLPSRQRLQWVDYAKGIGIFLVVVGHVLRGLVNSSILEASSLFYFIDRWLYAFHMPLFFLISGLFVQRSLSKPFKNYLLDKLYVIAYPYFLWSIIQTALQAIASSYTNKAVSLLDIAQIFYKPVMQFWFLYTLFIILIFYGILYKLEVKPKLFLYISLSFYLTHILNIDIGSWGILYLFRRHAIYFALGVIFGISRFLSDINHIDNRNLILATIGSYLIVGVAVIYNLDQNVVLIPIVALFGIVASITLAVTLSKSNILDFINTWGRLSLEIFVAHTIAASVLRIGLQILGIREPITHFILGIAISIYGPIALVAICQKLGFKYMFSLRHLKKRLT